MDNDLTQTFKRNMYVLSDIARIIEAVPYGDVTLSFKTHSNMVTSLYTNESVAKNYKEKETHIAIADIVDQIKKIHENKESKTLSLTLVFTDGMIRKVVNQYQKKEKYDKKV